MNKIDNKLVSKSQLRNSTENDLKEFLKRGGVVKVIEAKKPSHGVRTWAKR